jgi:hypothetical protein
MAFTEADRVQIRQYVGWSAIFLQFQPLLESAITTIQSIADGGIRIDNSTELLVKSLLTQLQAVDSSLLNFDCLGTNQVGNIQQDNIRARMVVMQWGRVLVGRLCTVLSLEGPIADCYSSSPSGPVRLGYSLGAA